MRSDKSNINSGAYRPAIKAGLVGSLHGLTVGAPTVSTNACTLVAQQVNSPTYTGASAVTATLPPATKDTVCVFSMADDPKGGTAALTFNCAGTDVWETGSVVPTTSGNKITYDVSDAGETNLVFTPTNNSVNFLSYGSLIEFVCEEAGKWYVNVQMKSDAGVTDGAATGTLLFAA
tara:strand:- start:436 stop:963 length:528 start_codon:yes stop_codon:yes gene_type:complete